MIEPQRLAPLPPWLFEPAAVAALALDGGWLERLLETGNTRQRLLALNVHQ